MTWFWFGLVIGLTAAEVEWTDSPALTNIWQATSSGETDRLVDVLVGTREAGIARSGDGRGPLFWAYEFKNVDALALLMHFQADEDAEDADGKRPRDFFPDGPEMLEEFKAEAEARLEEVVALLKDREDEFAQYQSEANLDYGNDGYDEMATDQRDEIDYADEEDEE